MRKFVAFSVLSLSLLGQSAFAALPPLWQSAAEIRAILNCGELSDYIDAGETIQQIQKEGDFYQISGTNSDCLVEVVYLPNDICGPAKFELIFHRLSQ